jgi:RNA polymerase sigma factor (TIGR02999 family)
MGMSDDPQITEFLQQWGAGDPQALEQILPLVYDQLRAIAENQMRRERPEHTLQATALVNELYLRLASQQSGQWKDRGHFFAFAAMTMRRILKDYARRTNSDKRGGGCERIPLSDTLSWLGTSPQEILSFDEALSELELSDPRKVRIVELRVLLGCSAREAAETLGISKATADREWTLAKAWLYRQFMRQGVLADRR